MTDNINKPEPLDLKKLREKCAESDAILIETAKVRSLIAEVERQAKVIDTLDQSFADQETEACMTDDLIRNLEAENDRLKAALEPFDQLSDFAALLKGDPDERAVSITVTVRDLRNAAAALSEGEG